MAARRLRGAIVFLRIEDGSLAVGVEVVVQGRSESLIRWGNQSAGKVDLPDKTVVRWSKLKLAPSPD